MPLLGCGDLNITTSEPFRDIHIPPRMTLDCKLSVLDEYNEAGGYSVGTAGQFRRVAHDPLGRERRMPYREEVPGPRVIIPD